MSDPGGVNTEMFRNPVTDAIVVLVIVMLIFGPKRLPMLGRSLGQGMREFKESITGNSTASEDGERIALTESTAGPAEVGVDAPSS
jgi:sec-independent protein translocase protein TatA